MKQARIRNSTDERSFIWPNAIQQVTPFDTADEPQAGLRICHIEYGNFSVLQITNTHRARVEVSDLVVNNEFQPAIGLFDQFRFLRFPVYLNPGNSFSAVLEVPPRVEIPMDCRYQKAPASLYVPTNRGYFVFNATSGECGSVSGSNMA